MQELTSSTSAFTGTPSLTADLVCQLSGAADGSLKSALPPGMKSPFEGLPLFLEYFDPRTRCVMLSHASALH